MYYRYNIIHEKIIQVFHTGSWKATEEQKAKLMSIKHENYQDILNNNDRSDQTESSSTNQQLNTIRSGDREIH